MYFSNNHFPISPPPSGGCAVRPKSAVKFTALSIGTSGAQPAAGRRPASDLWTKKRHGEKERDEEAASSTRYPFLLPLLLVLLPWWLFFSFFNIQEKSCWIFILYSCSMPDALLFTLSNDVVKRTSVGAFDVLTRAAIWPFLNVSSTKPSHTVLLPLLFWENQQGLAQGDLHPVLMKSNIHTISSTTRSNLYCAARLIPKCIIQTFFSQCCSKVGHYFTL